MTRRQASRGRATVLIQQYAAPLQPVGAARMFRPMDYGDTLEAEMLADYVSGGMTMIDAINALGLTVRTTYTRMAEHPKFAAMMNEAREQGFDALANECLAIADDSTKDHGARGMNSEFVQRSKLRVETRLKLLSKWHPKRYGEKLEIESKTASVAVPVGDDPLAAVRAYEQLLKGS